MFRWDSCSHPTIDGSWIGGRDGITGKSLSQDLEAHGYAGALAIGLPGVGGYSHTAFWEMCTDSDNLIPVAALTTVSSQAAIVEDLGRIQEVGYRIVKIHPRLLGYEVTLGCLDFIISACRDVGLAVALCTYPEYKSAIAPSAARTIMSQALSSHPTLPAVALHSGVLDPSPFVTLMSGNDHLLLDVSLSLVKYFNIVGKRVGSLANEHPRSVALGSDGPEWTYRQISDAARRLEGTCSEEAMSGLLGGALVNWLASVDPDLISSRM